jgi:GNAT superfamily N-acetyltransferase
MPLNIRRSKHSDHTEIRHLMDLARGAGLPEKERAEQGFVQGVMDESVLASLQEGTGIFVATDTDGTLAGFAITCAPEATSNTAALAALATVQSELADPNQSLFLYGPTVVSPNYRGQGVLSKLLAALSHDLAPHFNIGVAMVDGANTKSLAVHEHYGMRRTKEYLIEGRPYYAFSFDPTTFENRS